MIADNNAIIFSIFGASIPCADFIIPQNFSRVKLFVIYFCYRVWLVIGKAYRVRQNYTTRIPNLSIGINPN